jgi:CHAT domain-containing protein
MHLGISLLARWLNTLLPPIFHSLVVLPVILLLAGTLAAQSDSENKRVAAERLFREGLQLRIEGSKASLQQAIQKFAEAQPLFHVLNEGSNEALTLLAIGFIHNTLGERQEALAFFNQALPIFHAVGDRFNEALTLTNIGAVHNDLGEKQKAIDYHALALAHMQAIGNKGGEAIALNNMGAANNDLGKRRDALELFAKALPLMRAVGDGGGEAATLHNIGAVNADLGQWQQALDSYNEALPLFHAIGDRAGEAATLTDIGGVYDDLGEQHKALNFFSQALLLMDEAGDRAGHATTLTAIGKIRNFLGQWQEALQYYNQALDLSRAVGDVTGEATTLTNIGRVYSDLGEKQKALDYYGQALPLRRSVKDRQGEASTLNNIGATYSDLEEHLKAITYYDQALLLQRAVEDHAGEARTLNNIAHSEQKIGKLADALANLETSISILGSLRTKIVSKALRSSYFASVHDYFEFYIDLLMRLHKQDPAAGYASKALQANEAARTFAARTASRGRRRHPPRGETEPGGTRSSLQMRLNAGAQRQMQLLSGPHTEPQAASIAQEIENLTIELQQVEAQIRETSPQYAALTQPRPLSLQEIQTQVLDPDSLLLEYSLGTNRSYLWAVTPISLTTYELSDRDEIEASAKRLYHLLNARNEPVKGETQTQRATRLAQADKEIPAAAAGLSQMVLAPVAQLLGKKRLIIVADGVLQFIPFAVLPVQPLGGSAEQPLIVEHEIVSLPSASTLSVIRAEVAVRKPAPKGIAALADPVFMVSDVRVKGNGEAPNKNRATPKKEPPLPSNATNVKELQLVEASTDTGLTSAGLYVPRLSGSREEAKAIVAMGLRSESRLALDFEASRAVATSAELSQYRYVHFSTHGLLNSVHPELSGIVLSLVNERGEAQDGFLRAHEIFNLKLPAELVVLSACQTGIGQSIRGEGLMSLTRGFMYAGAPRIVVSLWSVSESGTTELMVRFYRDMLKKGLRPAAALRAAQISLMKEKRWSPPFYWAPFILEGEWR